MLQTHTRKPAGALLLEMLEKHGINDQADAVPDPGALVRLADLKRPEPGAESELIKHRFLCREGGMLLVGPTGVGKSAFSMQCAILWAAGRSAFGFEPTRALKILLCQAENDDGDLAEFRDGVIKGLELDPATIRAGLENIFVFSEKAKTGADLCKALDGLLAGQGYDILMIDPALSYLGGDSNKGADVTRFLRNELNPVLKRHQVGCVLVHHTVKPPREKGNPWRAGDLAYLGSGSAEFGNWARAVVGLVSVGSHDVYKVVVGKRGKRLQWQDDDANTITEKWVAHHGEPGVICWRLALPEEYAKYDKEAAAVATPGIRQPLEQRIANLWNDPTEELTKEQFIDRAKVAGIVRQTTYKWWAKGLSTKVFKLSAGGAARLTGKWAPGILSPSSENEATNYGDNGGDNGF